MSSIFKKSDIKAGYLLRVKNVESGEQFNMTVVPVAAFDLGILSPLLGLAARPAGHLACCAPGKHWWPLDEFDDQLECDGDEEHQVVAVYGYTAPKFLLDNSTEDRELLWERTATDDTKPVKMSLAEICEKLGHNVEIVES